MRIKAIAGSALESLKNIFSDIKYRNIDISYDNYALENSLYFDEICQELEVVLNLRSHNECKKYVAKFEEHFARAFGSNYAVGVSSGTAALAYSLISLGIGEGDEVITSPHTYISTALAVCDVGAKPVFVDIGQDYNIDIKEIENKITSMTKAIIPVHIYGNPCNMPEIKRIADKFNLSIIEDACQAHGAKINSKFAGSIGNLGCFSFHPSKIIGGLGDGGMIITNSSEVAGKIRKLREPEYDDPDILKSHRSPSSLGPIHIPFLKAKLKHLDEIILRRNMLAVLYNSKFSTIPEVFVPVIHENNRHCFRNYTLRVKDRDGLLAYLFKQKIEAKKFYDTPLHLREEFKYLGYKRGDFPVCESIYEQIISLPISHSLKEEQVNFIAQQVKEYYGK